VVGPISGHAFVRESVGHVREKDLTST